MYMLCCTLSCVLFLTQLSVGCDCIVNACSDYLIHQYNDMFKQCIAKIQLYIVHVPYYNNNYIQH